MECIPPLSFFSLLFASVAIMTKAYQNVERNELISLQEIASCMLLAVSLQSFGRSCFIRVRNRFSIVSDILNVSYQIS